MTSTVYTGSFERLRTTFTTFASSRMRSAEVCRRPAVSMSTRSAPSASARSMRVVAHACRVGAALARDHLHVGAARPHLQLLDGGGAERVGAAQDDLAASVVRFLGKLAHRGGLARAVDAHEQHARRVAAEDLLAAFGERVGDLVVEHVEHGIGIGKRLARGLVAQVLDDVARRRAADVGQDERFLQAVPELLVKVGTAVEQDVHLLLELVARTLQALG